MGRAEKLAVRMGSGLKPGLFGEDGGNDGGGEPGAGLGVEGGMPEPRGGRTPSFFAIGDLFANMKAFVFSAGVVVEPAFGIDLMSCDLVAAGSEAGLGGVEATSATGGAPEDHLTTGGAKGGDVAGEGGGEGLFEVGGVNEVQSGALEVAGPFGEVRGERMVAVREEAGALEEA